MQKNYFIFIIFLTLFILFIASLLNNHQSDIKSAIINDQKFDVELAKTSSQRETGLMNRDYLATNAGMLFIFPTADIYPFWMNNTLIPLDIIWIENGKIVDITTLDPPIGSDIPQYNPDVKANYVLEINAGLSNLYDFKIGDEVKFSTN